MISMDGLSFASFILFMNKSSHMLDSRYMFNCLLSKPLVYDESVALCFCSVSAMDYIFLPADTPNLRRCLCLVVAVLIILRYILFLLVGNEERKNRLRNFWLTSAWVGADVWRSLQFCVSLCKYKSPSYAQDTKFRLHLEILGTVATVWCQIKNEWIKWDSFAHENESI